MFAPNENPTESLPTTVSLQRLLSNQAYNLVSVIIVMETTLGANQWIDNGDEILAPDFNVILKAFEIRTFIVYLE